MKTLLAAFALIFCLLAPLYAQDAAPTLSPQQIAAQIKPLKAKTLILVFDVTESTRHGGVFTQERAASATLMREGCSPGDRVILMPFGTGYKTVFDKTLTGPADVDPLIDQLPTAPAPGHGTNIRLPHHAALKLIARENACPAVVVLLTDSFNDRPDLTDPNYPKYLAYYTLKGLTIYPKTRENSDYERLLRTLTAKSCLHQYGVGVGIAADGRPIERLPVGPNQGDSSTDTTTETPTVLAPTGTAQPHSILPLVLSLLCGLLLLGLLVWFLTRRRPISLRLKLGDKGLPRDYRLLPGTKLALGGAPGMASGSADTFPLAGLAAPLAFIQAERGSLTLAPAPPADGSPALFHNGIALKQPAPLRVGDEIRISVPATATDLDREHRVRVEDPRGPMF
ncbi:MAG: VWA domain-containing protein [Armatimonadota bacterium]|nr:VWA domain-containing protein [Armatimonadota bacterium]